MSGTGNDADLKKELQKVVKALRAPTFEVLLPSMQKMALRIARDRLFCARSQTRPKDSPMPPNRRGGRPKGSSRRQYQLAVQAWLDSLCEREADLRPLAEEVKVLAAGHGIGLKGPADAGWSSFHWVTLGLMAASRGMHADPKHEKFINDTMRDMRSAAAVFSVLGRCADGETPYPQDIRWIEDKLLEPQPHTGKQDRAPHLHWSPKQGLSPIAFLGCHAREQALGLTEHLHFGRCRWCRRLFVSLKAGTRYCPDRPRCATHGSPSRRKRKKR